MQEMWVQLQDQERNGNPLQYSHMGNPMNRGDWRATVHGVAKSHTHELKFQELRTTYEAKWVTLVA